MSHSLRFVALVTVLGFAGCGSGSGGAGADGGGGGFKPATPPADVCALLTLADVQAVMPGAVAGVGVEEQTANTSSVGFWARDCKYDDAVVTSRSMELVIFGAITQQGLMGIKLAAASGKTNTPVSGLGAEAHYWVDDPSIGTNGLWALDGSISVDVTAYFWDPIPTEPQLHPLVAKVLGAIK